MASLGTLVISVSVNAQAATTQLQNLTVEVKNFGAAFDGISSSIIARGNILSSTLQRIFSSVAGFVTSTFKEAIQASQNFNNALVSLAAVAEHFGVGMNKAIDAAHALSADGLLPLRDSAAGLKNLLMTGFGLDQAVGIMKAFKDTAAYARQETYSYGDAIRTATEGIKNMRSVQVDNAGVTKNLSMIMKDAGFVMQDIDSKTKGAAARQALYVGLLREAASQQGLAAASLRTYSGSVVALDTAYTSLLATWGDAITRNKDVAIAINFVSDAIRGLTQASADNNTAVSLVGEGLILFVKIAAVVVEGIKTMDDWFIALDIRLSELTRSIVEKVAKLADFGLNTFKWAMTGPATMFPGFEQGFGMLAAVSHNAHTAITSLGDDILETRLHLFDFDEGMGGTVKKLNDLAAQLEANKGKTIGLTDVLGTGRKTLEDFGNAADATAAKLRSIQTYSDLSGFIKKEGDLGGFSAAIDALIAKLPKVAEGLTHARDAMFGLEEVKTAYLMIQTMGGLENVALLNTTQLKALSKATQEAIEKMKGFHVEAPAAFKAFHDEAEDALSVLEAVKESIKYVADRATNAVGIDFEKDIPLVPFMTEDWGAARAGAKKEIGEVNEILKNVQNGWRKSFQSMAEDLPHVMARAMQSGASVWAAVGALAAKTFGDQFTRIFEQQQRAQGTLTPKLSTGSKVLALAGVGVDSFMGGYGLGQATGSKTTGALGGAASGALSGAGVGFMFGGPLGAGIGAAVGGVAGLIGGLFGASKKQKEIAQQLAQSRTDLLQQYGGMQKLQQLADKLGVSLAGAFNSKNPKDFEAAVKNLNNAIEDEKKKVEALNNAVTGLNARTATFIDKFKTLAETRDAALQTASDRHGTAEGNQALIEAANASQKLNELAKSSQGEFARLGVITQNVFAGIVKDSGDAMGAMLAMAPSFQVLKDGIEKFGLQSTAVIDELLKNFDLINNANFKPFFEAIQADGQVLKGLFDAKSLSPEGFQALAADIGASIQGVVDAGGDMARTLALSQPVLQTLWEASQQYGAITDENTQAILDQAEAQGLVGEAMKSVNDKILDVLLAIAHVFNADIPAGLEKTKKGAADAAADIEGAFKDVKIDPIDVPYKYQQVGDGPPDAYGGSSSGSGPAPQGVPALARGGIVRRPMYALIGEAGPEAVIPLTGAGLGVEASTYNTTIYLDGEKIAQSTARKLPKIMRGLGVGH